MLDFLIISERDGKGRRGLVKEIYPKFKVTSRTNDLMVRGGDFYAVWNEEKGLWSTSEDDVTEMIDAELTKYANEFRKNHMDIPVRVLYLYDSESGMIDAWHKYVQKQMRDNYHTLDQKLVFSNDTVNKKDYASKRLPYPLQEGDTTAYDSLMSVLYSPEERKKIEWAIGAIVAGQIDRIQKFIVLYGGPRTGKSTVLDIIQDLFVGYYSVFDAKALGNPNSTFALEPFKSNPLVGIQQDGDLSKIEDNTRLNSLVSHEELTVNEKYTKLYSSKFNTFLFMGTNKPVKITDAKSGIIRRLIDVSPTGNRIPRQEYDRLNSQIRFELGAIAYKCKCVFEEDPMLYENYIPIHMMDASNDMYNFVFDRYLIFKKQDGTTLADAWAAYKNYCDEARVPYPMSMRSFKEELRNYFDNFNPSQQRFGNNERAYNVYTGFKADKFRSTLTEIGTKREEPVDEFMDFKEQSSIFDILGAEYPAQLSTPPESGEERPLTSWAKATTKLKDIDTHELHYVKVPENHIVIDLDIPDKNGEKNLLKNIAAAKSFKPTYAELSKSGKGIHLHYIYEGDVSKLSKIYGDHIEVKLPIGNSAIRRKLTRCNTLPIATISGGLPLKEEVKKVYSKEGLKDAGQLRRMVMRCLNKEFGATKPCMDFIKKLTDEAYEKGFSYDLSDLKHDIIVFALSSTHQSDYCLKVSNRLHYCSKELEDESNRMHDIFNDMESGTVNINGGTISKETLVFYDIEVFPNLLLINWKVQGEGKPVVRMINPSPNDIAPLLRTRLVGFNCRRYDNHILYAAYLGYSNEQLFNLSQSIIVDHKGFIKEAYSISYTDIYDFASTKQSLKKWEIEMGIHHQELGYPWDKPVPEDKWVDVAEYCDNDVIATEKLFEYLQGDFIAREILADLAGMTVNDTTNSLTTRIIFGNDRHPVINYVHLEDEFPGYSYEKTSEIVTLKNGTTKEVIRKANMYRGVDLGFGGYVYAEPGMYKNVALLDVASLHPHSAIAMNAFGEYTQRFADLVNLRVAIKHKDYEKAKLMFDGKLAKYLDDEAKAKQLAQALKIAINAVYGLTSASFDNPFKDPRNVNNIVALRGALFMKTLQDEVQARGFTVAHIKTDSIKIPEATDEIIQFCMEFAKKYGYTFEHEATYERMCLVNNAVYIAKYADGKHEFKLPTGEKIITEWTATGKQFQVPYIFKKLFCGEKIVFDDLCETKQVDKGALYLDYNEGLPEGEHDYQFVGRIGQFCPVVSGKHGGVLLTLRDDKYDSATGAKGYLWMESEKLRLLGEKAMDFIDFSYFEELVRDAKDNISQFCDFNAFVNSM